MKSVLHPTPKRQTLNHHGNMKIGERLKILLKDKEFRRRRSIIKAMYRISHNKGMSMSITNIFDGLKFDLIEKSRTGHEYYVQTLYTKKLI